MKPGFDFLKNHLNRGTLGKFRLRISFLSTATAATATTTKYISQ